MSKIPKASILLGISFVFVCAIITFFSPKSSAYPQNRSFEDNLKNQTKDIIIKIENKKNGKIYVLTPFNDHWEIIGKVLKIPKKAKYPAFNASKWGKKGQVVATAVNAIHLLCDIKNNRGKIYTISPINFKYQPWYIKTNIKAGKGLFSEYAPTVGYKVRIKRNNKVLLLNQIKRLKENDVIYLIPQKISKKDIPVKLIIENKEQGKVTLYYLYEKPKIIGTVKKPVLGVGRFSGSKYQYNSRVRANHPGVLCISTSPYGKIGGFQIIPYIHSLSPEMKKSVWNLTQWLVIKPLNKKTFAGTPPIFYGYITPAFYKNALKQKNWVWFLLRRTAVLCKIKGKDKWVKLPLKTGRNDYALKDITHIKILFPLHYLWHKNMLSLN